MAVIRISSFLLISLLSYQAFGAIQWSDARREARDLAIDNHRPLSSYSYARQVVMQEIHLDKDQRGYFIKDVYCLQDFRRNVGPNRMPDHTEINIEHTWPQSRFNGGQSRRTQKADLHHLYPTDSQSNSTRGNHTFSEVERARPVSRSCYQSHVGVNPETGHQSFEPPQEHKGNVARALFYFSVRYDIEIPDSEEIFLRIWHAMDPVDDAELKRNEVVSSHQGNRNPFIDMPELADMIDNF